jgi:hypothetical protein
MMASPTLQSEATPLPHNCVSYNAIGADGRNAVDLERGLSVPSKAGKANRHSIDIAIRSSSSSHSESTNAADDPTVKSESPTQGSLRAFVAKNEGLLLVAASQAFFAFMNVGVKFLNSIDPPVHALEVSARGVSRHCAQKGILLLGIGVVDRCSDGVSSHLRLYSIGRN